MILSEKMRISLNAPESFLDFKQKRIIEGWIGEVAQLEAYCDKLADGLPEGMLPKDIEILRKANIDMAERIAQLETEVELLWMYYKANKESDFDSFQEAEK